MGWIAIDHPEELKNRLDTFSAMCSPTNGNLFINHEFSDRWVEKGQVRLFQTENALFFLRKRRECSRCYFLARELSQLPKDFEELFSSTEEKIITSVLDRNDRNQRIKELLKASGFRPYALMKRIVKINQNPKPSKIRVHYAKPEDLQEIEEMILKYFDPLIDQNPDRDEIEAAIREQRILVEYETKEHRVAGISSFERQGATLYARYLATEEAYRKVASYVTILWRNLLRLHSDARTFIGWVREENSRALELNRLLGLEPDGTTDEVFLYGN